MTEKMMMNRTSLDTLILLGFIWGTSLKEPFSYILLQLLIMRRTLLDNDSVSIIEVVELDDLGSFLEIVRASYAWNKGRHIHTPASQEAIPR
jgi:hypothetical protein